MKTSFFRACCALLALTASLSCEMLDKAAPSDGEIVINFAYPLLKSSRSAIPDTNDFLLEIKNSGGSVIYSGKFGAAPQTIQAPAGTYTVSALSCEFREPAFECPQYGATKVISVSNGRSTRVELVCTQLNAGFRLRFDELFRFDHPDANLCIKGADGELMYSLSETRMAYFRPGAVNLWMDSEIIYSRVLEEQQNLTLTLGGSQEAWSGSGGMRLSVDTSRVWVSDNMTVGADSRGSDKSSALDILSARACAPCPDVWVYWYIVGGDLSSSKCSFDPPFASNTNLVLATKSSCRDKSVCLSVQLAKGDVRDALNLVDHPELLGRSLLLRGDLVSSYYGIPGLQSISEYELK